MNAERLLSLYEKVAGAPDAVPRLRRFVLDLAVRGKLVAQNSDDEPASKLLKRIASEKARLVKAGEIRKQKPFEPIGELPFAIPRSWSWTHLGFIAAYIQRGKSPKYAAGNGAPVISQKCVQWTGLDLSVSKQVTLESLEKYEPIRFLRDGDLLWNSTGTGTIGRVVRVVDPPKKLICDSHVTVVRCVEVDPEYVRTWLRTDHVYGVIEERAAGSTNQVELTSQMANSQPIPLPPLPEQQRIVAKVEELMDLLDQLEAARTAREATRDRLTAASLIRLTAPDTTPAEFPSHARFALDTLPALTARPDQIKLLRQTILNLAVRGKLAKQNPTDESLDLSQSDDVESLQTLPTGWRYVRLTDLLAENTRNGFSRRPDDAVSGVPILRISAGTARQDGIVAEEEHKLISGIDAATRLQYGLKRGDLLACRFNGNKAFVGRLTLFNDYLNLDPIYPDKLIRVRLEQQLALPEFVRMAGESDLVRGSIEEFCTTTVGNWGISASNLKEVPIPLPPLAEQHRIVAKVDALMTLCDRLESSLAAADNSRARLIEALLHECLAPEDATTVAAA